MTTLDVVGLGPVEVLHPPLTLRRLDGHVVHEAEGRLWVGDRCVGEMVGAGRCLLYFHALAMLEPADPAALDRWADDGGRL